MPVSRFFINLLKNPLFWSIIVFALVAALVVSGIGGVSDSVAEQQTEMLENSVRRSAVQCYALEGTYPENVNYLVSNYGLFYDKDNYIIHYEFNGSNLLPTIAVIYVGDAGERITPPTPGLSNPFDNSI